MRTQVWFIPFMDKHVGMQEKLCDHVTTCAMPDHFCNEVAISSVIYVYLYYVCHPHIRYTDAIEFTKSMVGDTHVILQNKNEG